MSEEEEIFLSQHVSELVAWHRKSMLPMYSFYLNDIADKLQFGQYGAEDIEKVLVMLEEEGLDFTLNRDII